MKVHGQIVALSALAIAVSLAGCDSGPGAAPKIQATQEQPAEASAGTSTQPGETAAVAEPKAVDELKNVHFDLDQAKIRSRDARILQDHASWLKSRQAMTVTIGGHADERGSDAHNLKLAERRANAVRGYLIAQGVEADRLAITSHGERRPTCSDQHESCWGKNRRAEFEVEAR